MTDGPYASLQASLPPGEPFVRRALAAIEADFRTMAQAALADWSRIESAGDETAEVVTRPGGDWASWNGLVLGLQTMRRRALAVAGLEERRRIEAAGTLARMAAILDEPIGDDLARALEPLAERTGRPIDSPRLGEALSLLVALATRLAYDPPADPGEWELAAAALRPLVEHLARRDPFAPFRPAPDRTETGGVPASTIPPVERRDGATAVALARPAPRPAFPGVLLGDCLVGAPVGRGGFATVHRGLQLSTDRTVAVKILHDGLPDDARLRLRHEAVFLSRFDHPHIVRVLGAGEGSWRTPAAVDLSGEAWFARFSRGAPVKTWLAMEWIEGETLDAVWRRGESRRRPLGERVRWFAQAAGALATVHAAGLIHRDVKPSNLMIATGGVLKLMDFGIARPTAETRTLVTAEGHALGTLAYMSPEQLLSHDGEAQVGPGTDVYSLSATFYEIFTGARFLEHDRTGAEALLMKKVRGERPEPPRRLAPELPWELETILLGGLEADPTDRYASAAALERDIRRFLADEPIEYARPSIPRRMRLAYRRNQAVSHVAGIGLVALLGLAVHYVTSIRAERDAAVAAEERATSAREDAERERAAADRERAEARAAEARAVAARAEAERGRSEARAAELRAEAAREESERRRREVQEARAEVERRLADALVEKAQRAREGLRLLEAERWMAAALRHDDRREIRQAILGLRARGANLAWTSPAGATGTALAYDRWGGLLAAARPGGGIQEWVLEMDDPYRTFGDGTATAIARHADDERSLAAVGTGGGRVEFWDLAEAEPRSLGGEAAHRGPVRALAIDAAGRRLVSAGEDGALRVWDLETRRPGPPIAGLEGPVTAMAIDPSSFDRLVAATADGAVRRVDLETGRSTVLARLPRPATSLALAPGGGRLAAASGDGTIRLWSLPGGEPGPSLVEPGVRAVVWSPDGRLLASGGADGVVRVRWEATLEELPPFDLGGPILAVQFAPDGEEVAALESDLEVSRCRIETGQSWRLAELGSSVVATSPAGRVAWAGPDGEIRIRDLEGRISSRPAHDGGVLSLHFGADERLLSTGADGAVRLWSSAGEPAGLVARPDGQPVWAAVFVRGGRAVAVAGIDGKVRVFEAGRRPLELATTNGPLVALAVDRTGTRLAAAQDGDGIWVWDLEEGEAPREIGAGIQEGIRPLALALTPDGRELLALDQRGALLWTAVDFHGFERDHATLSIPITGDEPGGLAISSSGRRVAAIAADRTIRVWDLPARREILVLPTGGRLARGVALGADGGTLAVASPDGSLEIWALGDSDEVRSLPGRGTKGEGDDHSPSTEQVAFAGAGALVWGSDDAEHGVRLIDPATGRDRAVLVEEAIEGALAAAGDRIVVTSDGLRLFDPTTGRETGAIEAEDLARGVLALEPGRGLIAFATYDRTIHVRDLATGNDRTFTIPGDDLDSGSAILEIGFSPEGDLVAALDADGIVHVWDEASGERIATWPTGSVWGGLVFLPGGRLVTGGSHRSLRFWEARTARELALLSGSGGPAGALAAHGGERPRLAAGTLEGTVRLVDAAPARAETRLELAAHDAAVTSLAFSPDGKHLATAGLDRTVRIWDLEAIDRFLAASPEEIEAQTLRRTGH